MLFHLCKLIAISNSFYTLIQKISYILNKTDILRLFKQITLLNILQTQTRLIGIDLLSGITNDAETRAMILVHFLTKFKSTLKCTNDGIIIN
jgi:hypothetical protein